MRAASESRRLHAQQLLLTAPVFGIAFAALLLAPGRLDLGHESPHGFALLGIQLTYPGANLAALLLLAIAALGAVVLIRALRLGSGHARAHAHLVRSLPVAGSVPRHRDVLVVDDPRPQAFCAGLLRPRAYVSSGALAVLAPPELDAVIAHERAHRRARDPLRRLVSGVAAQALFELPPYRLIAERLGTACELSADAAALAASGGDRRPLANALLVMTEAGDGAVGLDPERVDALAGSSVRVRVPRVALAATSGLLALLAVSLWQALRTAHFQASLALPGVSSKPCVLALALVPVSAALLARRSPRARD